MLVALMYSVFSDNLLWVVFASVLFLIRLSNIYLNGFEKLFYLIKYWKLNLHDEM